MFTNTAAALPCELGADDEVPPGSAAARSSRSGGGGMLDWLPASKYQVAWAQRVVRSKQRQAAEAGGVSP